ncbi:MAG: N-6 DNA methylase [Candidatus Pelethousia sp.]|nr:N-6 DNA methylase [Candidatus Pelethousia sp.]
MLGAIIGDIVGSRFEWNNNRSKDFDFLSYHCFTTDDSIMSLAVAKAVLECSGKYDNLGRVTVRCMQEIGRPYPDCGYGGMFRQWMYSDSPKPYNSFGNGAAMRISACGFAATSLEEAIMLSRRVTEVTHNHPEGIKGAEATTIAIWLARKGHSIIEVRDYINKHYYPMNFTLAGIRDTYTFNETCQETVPQAIMAFLESTDFEDAIRNAISIGGDSDTIAAITGGIAEAYYGIPTEIRKHALTFLDERLLKILLDFENAYPPILEKSHDRVPAVAKKTRGRRKTKTGSREQMIISALEAADEDDNDSFFSGEQTTSQRLFSHLFEACNILRGPINQDEYKSYVTPLLFFKRLSDVYDEETARAMEDSGGDEEYASFPENHRFLIPDGCHWKDVREKSENVGSAIVNAMVGIERANPDTLFGVFSSFDDANWTDKSKLSDERLKDLVEHMSKIKVGNENYSADVMGDSYEYLIKKFADLSKKNAGEFYTPRPVVRLMVKLLAPQIGETVYDPACGTGGMLIEAINYIKNDKMTYGKIFGQEKNLSTSAIARMNLFLHGAQDFKVTQGDTLRSPNYLYRGELQTFHCVIANPPFSLKNWGAEQFSSDIYGRNIWGSPTDSNADFAWLQHMVKSMDKKTGRCAVVLPQGVLFRSGKEGDIRKQLILSDKLDCVITLVSNLFYGAGVSACILLLDNNKPDNHKGKVCLIDGSGIFTAQRAKNILSDADVETLFGLYTDYEDVLERAKIVTIKDLADKDYTLQVNSYIEKRIEESVSPEEVKRDFFGALEAVHAAEDRLYELLVMGGYIHE